MYRLVLGNQLPWSTVLHQDDGGRDVTINTDNRGISRTTLSREYLRAAAMMPKGLTRWQVLQLVRNGFRAAFCDYQTRQQLMRDAETEIVKLV
ncbi:MAG TPA: hypothetical protein ENJ16_03265 [Planctomycetaceae bacterium]|nr:hypothetical protein [Planctomycetaceae bacterium]